MNNKVFISNYSAPWTLYQLYFCPFYLVVLIRVVLIVLLLANANANACTYTVHHALSYLTIEVALLRDITTYLTYGIMPLISF
jgi:hypothetical protein